MLIETNIDDMNPQFNELLLERLLEAGALDVWLTPIQMKKSRPATDVSVIAPQERSQASRTPDLQTSTLGVRISADRAGESGAPDRDRGHALGRCAGQAAGSGTAA